MFRQASLMLYNPTVMQIIGPTMQLFRCNKKRRLWRLTEIQTLEKQKWFTQCKTTIQACVEKSVNWLIPLGNTMTLWPIHVLRGQRSVRTRADTNWPPEIPCFEGEKPCYHVFWHKNSRNRAVDVLMYWMHNTWRLMVMASTSVGLCGCALWHKLFDYDSADANSSLQRCNNPCSYWIPAFLHFPFFPTS